MTLFNSLNLTIFHQTGYILFYTSYYYYNYRCTCMHVYFYCFFHNKKITKYNMEKKKKKNNTQYILS